MSLANATAPLSGTVYEAANAAYTRGAAASNAAVDQAIASLSKRLPGQAAADVQQRADAVVSQVHACTHARQPASIVAS